MCAVGEIRVRRIGAIRGAVEPVLT